MRKDFAWRLGAALLGVFFFAVYWWNAWHYNVWSSYDGGGHIDYIFDLAAGQGLPRPKSNYLAWHEPAYYAANAVLVRVLQPLGLSREALYKILQLESAVFAWAIAAAAGVLAWQTTRRRSLAFFVAVFTGSLFVVSASGRYITNETLFQALALWWLAWFMQWRMWDTSAWSARRWSALALGLSAILWVKLSGFILLAALLIFLGIIAWRERQWRPLFVGAAVAGCVLLSYVPWMIHKQRLYGQALTINNYEVAVRPGQGAGLPARFFLTWDTEIWQHPFWTAGRGSFWSLLTASALGDYDNIFQNYAVHGRQVNFVTANGRTMAVQTAALTLALYWWSVPLLAYLAAGFLVSFWRLLRGQLSAAASFLLVTAAGFLTALIYNVYRYPYLERGTLKAIFIVSFFPLAAILAGASLPPAGERPHRRLRFIAVLVYFIFWLGFSLSIVILPAL